MITQIIILFNCCPKIKSSTFRMWNVQLNVGHSYMSLCCWYWLSFFS